MLRQVLPLKFEIPVNQSKKSKITGKIKKQGPFRTIDEHGRAILFSGLYRYLSFRILIPNFYSSCHIPYPLVVGYSIVLERRE